MFGGGTQEFTSLTFPVDADAAGADSEDPAWSQSWPAPFLCPRAGRLLLSSSGKVTGEPGRSLMLHLQPGASTGPSVLLEGETVDLTFALASESRKCPLAVAKLA